MRRQVLAVEDDERLRRLLQVNIQSDEIEVTEAGTGEECLRLAREKSLDLILLDLNLPDCSGSDVLATLRRSELWKDIPVIVLSVVPPDKTMIQRWRPEQYLQKPFDARELPGRVRRALGLRGVAGGSQSSQGNDAT
ncbi:MAG: response regulator [Chloroflexi bacterium]|nr:response regulator [Chloroflexota bacterium]